MTDRLTIAVDTREQTPWTFPEDIAVTRRMTVPTGDYALILESGEIDAGFAIERKSLTDFVGTISSDWERFAREIARMDAAGFPLKVIVVEGSDLEIIQARYDHPSITPAFVTSKIVELEWMDVHVHMAQNPHRAAQIAWRHLYERSKRLNDPFWGVA